MTTPGIPMIFQGQEMHETQAFHDDTALRWNRASTHAGIVQAYTDLIQSRRNLRGGMQGLKGTGVNVHHVDNTNKVVAFVRWDAGGQTDDVVVVANFANTTWNNNNYMIPFPSAGTWYSHFNSDSQVYQSDFGNVGSAQVTASGSPATAAVNMGPYSIQIFSRQPAGDPPPGAESSSATFDPAEPVGCVPVTITYTAGDGPLANASQVYIHIGRNGWQDVIEPNPAMTPLGDGQWQFTYNTPPDTWEINLVFNDGADTWDSNSFQDWRLSYTGCGTQPATVTFDPPAPEGCVPITITYDGTGRPLHGAAQVFIHIGRNGWQDVIEPNPEMTWIGGERWEYTYLMPPHTTQINLVFNDGLGTWDNNNMEDWHLNVNSCGAVDPGPATRIAFATPPRSVVTGLVSDLITVELRDQLDQITTSEEPTVISLSSNQSGTFRNAEDTANITSVTIGDGQSSASFRYTSTTLGTHTLSASHSTLTGATQNLTVRSATLGSQVYNDSTGDIFPPYPHLDITSVEVSHTATDLLFRITVAGNPSSPDWGKYMIGIDSAPGGDTAGNGWGRPIRMSSGMNYWVGAWVDAGNGGQVWNWTGSAWNMRSMTGAANPDNISVTKDTTTVYIQFEYAGLGLNLGDSFSFDVYSSGGGDNDGAIDAAANPGQSISDWGQAYNSGSLVFQYTLATPAPKVTTAAVTGVGSATATAGGNVTDEGGAPVTERGVVWNTTGNPTTDDNKATAAGGLGAFTAPLSGLSPNTTYYVRAYAINAEGTGYGAVQSFTTLCFDDLPEALPATDITGSSFTANWASVPGATGYRLDVSTSETFAVSGGGSTYTVDFEGAGETKTSTSTATVTLSGLTWSFNGQAIIGTASGDKKNGARSARIFRSSSSNLGSMTMTQDLPTGLGTISFLYARYASETSQPNLVVEYSTNQGGSWTNIGTLSSPYPNNLTEFSQAVNVSGNVRVRFRVTNSGTSNRHINIDDIVLTPHAPDVPSFVPGYENLFVSGTSVTVSGLDPDVTYFYRVRAERDGLCVSDNSNTQAVTTADASDPWLTDSNGDGIPDGWYLQFGFDPHGPSIADIDSDGDGFTNRQEFLLGTDPTDPNSRFRATSVEVNEAGHSTVTWTSVGGRTYSVEYTNDLNLGFTQAAVVTEDAVADGVETTRTFVDDGSLTGGPTDTGRRFYRIRLIVE